MSPLHPVTVLALIIHPPARAARPVARNAIVTAPILTPRTAVQAVRQMRVTKCFSNY